MKKIVIYQHRITAQAAEELMRLCPFGAIEGQTGDLRVNAACKLCGQCVKGVGAGLIEIVEEEEAAVDKSAWRGVAVFVDYTEGSLHPVSLELLGKARALADETNQPVYGILIGFDTGDLARQLLRYGVDDLYCYDDEQFHYYLVEPYAAALSHFIRETRPSAILFGATNAGRSLAPRVAARFRTGLTADCTALEMKENGDLIQIRPAFGGNIMARILTANHRPQMCTVRYKIFDRPQPMPEVKGDDESRQGAVERSGFGRGASGRIHRMPIDKYISGVEILEQIQKPRQTDISEAELILALGRGVANKKDIAMFEDFAALIGAQIACTRPVAESGWLDPRLQIGLSGRTVKPKLILCAGISGSVQFAAGMRGSYYIVAMNKDPQAPIFNIAHLGLVGDIYEVLPLVAEIARSRRREGAAV
jgi:electron transfer flavoprotein alpha subunit